MDKEKKEKNERTNVINRLKEDGNEKKKHTLLFCLETRQFTYDTQFVCVDNNILEKVRSIEKNF